MTLPQRSSARLLILDPDGRLLLFRYDDGREQPFWATPGGQLLRSVKNHRATAEEVLGGIRGELTPPDASRDQAGRRGGCAVIRLQGGRETGGAGPRRLGPFFVASFGLPGAARRHVGGF